MTATLADFAHEVKANDHTRRHRSCWMSLSNALLVACSETKVSGSLTSSSSTPSTDVPATTSSSTTSTSTTSTTLGTTTTSAIPAVLGLDLSADGGRIVWRRSHGRHLVCAIDSWTTDTRHRAGSTRSRPGSGTGVDCYVIWGDFSHCCCGRINVRVNFRRSATSTYGPAAGEFVDPFGLSIEERHLRRRHRRRVAGDLSRARSST